MNRLSIVIVGISCLGAPGLATAEPRSRVSIDSVPSGAAIYLEDKEAGAQGQTPHSFNLAPGSYTFILEAEGYEPFSRTVEVRRNKGLTLTFTLVKRPPPTEVAIQPAPGSGVEGATVRVNGKDTGTVPLTLRLQSGRYLIEVTKQGYETWSEWTDAKGADRRTIVVSLVKSAAGTGSLLVSSNIMGAEVFVDGKRVDTAPALLERLPPGKRTVEVRAKGYLMKQQEVAVEAGATTKVTLELQPDQQTVAASGGTLQVLASHKEVQIFIDGKPQGTAPVKVEGLAEGSHLVEGRKPGMIVAEETLTVKKGELRTIKLALKEAPLPKRTGALRVVSPVLGAEVFVDGGLKGKTPLLTSQLDPGPHFVTVRAKGHDELVQTVEVKAGQIAEVKAVLTKATTIEEVDRMVKKQPAPAPEETPVGLSSYGAHLVAPSSFTGDVSLGFAHIFEGRLTAGFFSRGMLAMDGGVEFRTFGAMSEIGVHARLRLLRQSMVALALLFSAGGGGGPSSRNTAYANLGVVGSLWFKKLVTFSARAYFNLYSDRLCPSTAGIGNSEVAACGVSQPDILPTKIRERISGTRFFLSAILEVPVSRRVNLFALLEGAPFQGGRYLFTDRFADIMPDSDPGLYFRVGATFKY